MLNINKAMVNTEPFPHVATEEFVDRALYDALEREFPDDLLFDEERGRSGNIGSRTGQGFDIYRGDEAYDLLMRRSDAWRTFDEFINSASFVGVFLELFGDALPDLGCRHRIQARNYRREVIEPREVMTERASTAERVIRATRKIWRAPPKNKDVELFSRLDIHRARSGYGKTVHCDRPNRVCTMVLYFCEAEERGIEGGNLTLHKHRVRKNIAKYERHPDPEDVVTVAEIRPRDNFGVFFPCCNNSYHGVTPVKSGKEIARDYLYISISATSYRLW